MTLTLLVASVSLTSILSLSISTGNSSGMVAVLPALSAVCLVSGPMVYCAMIRVPSGAGTLVAVTLILLLSAGVSKGTVFAGVPGSPQPLMRTAVTLSLVTESGSDR